MRTDYQNVNDYIWNATVDCSPGGSTTVTPLGSGGVFAGHQALRSREGISYAI
jgi:hypothetical protein